MAISFDKLKLGYASAELEGASAPELLTDGYFNMSGVIDAARLGNRFLFLGYKGSGKSAIAEHLKLTAGTATKSFVQVYGLADFPYSSFKSIVRGKAEPESKYPTAWSWLILISLFDSLLLDRDLSCPDSSEKFDVVVQALRSAGLIPAPSWKQLTLATSKRSFHIGLERDFATNLERSASETGLEIPFFVEHMKVAVAGIRSRNRHILAIDGLDDILTTRHVQYDALAALILAASRLNLEFLRQQVPIKVIILSRTDLYERLPGPNKNKVRQDSAVELDWYSDPRQPNDSGLVKLVNMRAHLSDSSVSDLFSEYFPRMVEDRDPRTFLLELTRHTPRDLIQALCHIQRYAHTDYVTKEQVLSGTRSYSINYFLPEIKDELVGYVGNEDIDRVVELLGSLRKRDFLFDELESMARQNDKYVNLDLRKILRALFECSAVGNVDYRTGGMPFYTFRFRNRSSVLDLQQRLILHRGLWKALNLA